MTYILQGRVIDHPRNQDWFYLLAGTYRDLNRRKCNLEKKFKNHEYKLVKQIGG